MQGGYTGHLLKRGVHFASECLRHKQAQAAQNAGQPVQIYENNSIEDILNRFQSPEVLALFGVTLFLYFIFSSAADYTINTVVTNLAIVESTDGGKSAVLAVSDEPDAPLEKKPLMDDFEGKVFELPAGEPLPTQPITAKLRTAIQHLHSVGGFRARFRGLRFAAFYHIVFSIFSFLFNAMVMPLGPFGFWIGSALAAICSCNVHAAWTHATISKTTDKGFFQRFLPRPVARQLIMPTLRLHFSIGLLQLLVTTSFYTAWMVVNDERVPRYLSINLFLLPVLVGITFGLLGVLPSYISLVRAEASLLPEDEDAIVPFDRTFGGRFLQADTSRQAFFQSMRHPFTFFDRETFRRVVKMQVKFFMIAFAISFAFATLLVAQIYFVAGGEDGLVKLIEYVRKHENL